MSVLRKTGAVFCCAGGVGGCVLCLIYEDIALVGHTAHIDECIMHAA